MTAIVQWLESLFGAMPLPLLEVWGRFGFIVGFLLMLTAFSGLTFRTGGRWGLGWVRQTWDGKALLSCAITAALVIGSGWLGSFIVLVPGAQTFESLKDVMVFVCILLFGYPALVVIPFAYGCSDLIEGVPPGFLMDWWLGYFINPACFWVAYQLFGKRPDFRRPATWGLYLPFVVLFMGIEPELWGYICAGKFTADISYRNITPALFFTTAITWAMAPCIMLAALPLARRCGLFWAEIPGHARERRLGQRNWHWQSGTAAGVPDDVSATQGLPIRVLIAAPFIALVLLTAGVVAYLTLGNAESTATKLVSRLHAEVSENINLQFDAFIDHAQGDDATLRTRGLEAMLAALPIAKHGRAFVIDRSGHLIASSQPRATGTANSSGDAVVQEAVHQLTAGIGDLTRLTGASQFRFDIVTAKPLSHETWLAQATPYQDNSGKIDWIEITVLPESYFLEGVRAGNSQAAMVLAVALILALLIAILLAVLVTMPIRRIATSVEEMAEGDLTQRVAASRLGEFASLATSINFMATQLQESFRRTRSNEERLHLATSAGRIGVWDWDVVRNELTWDDSMYALYGLRREDFGGAFDAWIRTVHPDDRQFAEGEIQAALRGDHEYAPEFRIIRPDGTVHSLKASSMVFRDPSGKAIRMIGTNVDITERILAEQELNRHRQHLEELVKDRTRELSLLNQLVYGSLESATVGAWWIDFTEHDTFHALDTTARIIGVPVAQGADKAYRLSMWQELMAATKAAHPEHGETIDATLERFAGTIAGRYQQYRAIYPIPRADGTFAWIDARADVSARDADGRARFMTGTLIDITSQKTTEEALRVAHERAEAGNRAKSSFLANMSHELRTPMNAILGFAQLMARDATASPPQRKHLGIILSSGEHLLGLINHVLELAKVEAGKSELELQEVDLEALFRDLIAMLHQRAEAKGIALLLDQSSSFPRHVRTDPAKLRQIAINLVGNAIKFTAHGEVAIKLGCLAQTDGSDRLVLCCEIRDTGPGIAPADLERVFLPFEQLSQRPGTEGSGLGLAITREYVHLLGGTISASSEPGQGSCFRFTIACERVDEARIPALTARPERLATLAQAPHSRLLIVEDQTENRLLLQGLLAPFDFQLKEATDGQEALALVRTWQPHLVLMDWRMPVMDGLTATREIRRLATITQPVIIAVSAHAFKEEREAMLAAGCNGFLTKPFRDEELFALLATHLAIALKDQAPDAAAGVPLPPAPDLRAELQAIPRDLCRALHDAAVLGDISEIELLLPGQPRLQAVLTPLLSNFQLQPIVDATQAVLDGGT